MTPVLWRSHASYINSSISRRQGIYLFTSPSLPCQTHWLFHVERRWRGRLRQDVPPGMAREMQRNCAPRCYSKFALLQQLGRKNCKGTQAVW